MDNEGINKRIRYRNTETGYAVTNILASLNCKNLDSSKLFIPKKILCKVRGIIMAMDISASEHWAEVPKEGKEVSSSSQKKFKKKVILLPRKVPVRLKAYVILMASAKAFKSYARSREQRT